jgi:murein DD-endopeptidase MepM/ murein hydrolase activator NlpD
MSETAPGGVLAAASAAVVAVPVALLLLLVLILGGDTGTAASCGPAATVDVSKLPENVDGYGRDQLGIAAMGMNAAATRQLGKQGQIVAVAAAIGESGLRNIGYGDDIHGVTNPDGSATCSLGVLQQQWCLGWGTKEQVLDPVYAFGTFLDRLVKVPGWQDLDVSIAINKVQGNADPHHYAKFVAAATAIVTALTGKTGNAAGSCGGGAWQWPIVKTAPRLMISDFFGTRNASITGYSYLHNGVDFSVPEGTPVHAAAAGKVTAAVTGSGGAMGNTITLEHPGGIRSQYLHLSAVDVAIGDQVTTGQVIGKSGNTGRSTGAHLHFTILTDGASGTAGATDPITFLRSRGVDLCSLPVWSGHTVASTCTGK